MAKAWGQGEGDKYRTLKALVILFTTSHGLHIDTRAIILTLIFLSIFNVTVLAQPSQEHAEMERLEMQANDLIANGDPSGAAQSIGKAAMMADILAKNESDEDLQKLYVGTEDFFRTQEHAYQALAMFEQAGGQAPAPNGACQLLSLAKQQHAKARRVFSNINPPHPSRATRLVSRYAAQFQEWTDILHELEADFSCC